jgi:N-acetyl-anhydromuramyl-L-alanine amidase AmpD
MAVSRTNVDFAKRIGRERVGNDYVYGGVWSAGNKDQGTDCSGICALLLDAVVNGAAMRWSRLGLSTESWRPIEVGQTGPMGTVCVASPKDFPADAAVKLAIHHGPGGGVNSHMWCELDGVRFESNGTDGCVTGSQARDVNDTSYANDWHYLPGPIVGTTAPTAPTAPALKPDFTEFWVTSNNKQPRGGTKIDLFLLHTQEGNGTASSLANYLANPNSGVSYHYTVDQDLNTGKVTVCDVVDTDFASWSALSANNRSINLCFAGSTARWSRDEWMRRSKAIEVAAYLAVEDAKKYKFTPRVLAPPYSADPPGISDHKYVTQYLGDGNHTDVGDNFPWDFFTAAVKRFVTGAAAPTLTVTTPTVPAPGPSSSGGGSMASVPQDQWDRVYQELTKRFPSRSPLRHLSEGLVDTWAGMDLNIDAHLHMLSIKTMAELGDLDALTLLAEVAGADPGKYPDRQRDASLARAILADIEATRPQVIKKFLAATKKG